MHKLKDCRIQHLVNASWASSHTEPCVRNECNFTSQEALLVVKQRKRIIIVDNLSDHE